MPTINIPNHKTYFMTRFFSTPGNGVLSYSCPSFFNVSGGDEHYSGGIGKLLTLYAEENTSSVARTGVLSITGTTDTTAGYEGNAVIVCSWTINQEAAPAPPAITCEFNFRYYSPASVTNNSNNDITFEGASYEGSNSYAMYLPIAKIGTGFDGTVNMNSTSEIGLTGEQTASQTYSSGDNMQVQLGYNFVGDKADDQYVGLEVIFSTASGQKRVNLSTTIAMQNVDFSDWFVENGSVDIDVSFRFVVSD